MRANFSNRYCRKYPADPRQQAVQIMYTIYRSIIAVGLCLLAPLTLATPLEARAPKTVYEYMKPTPVAMPAATFTPRCLNSTVTNADDCPSGCTAAAYAGMLGVATSKFKCMVPKPITSFTSYMATSTCEAGSFVTTYSLWGGDQMMGCHASA